jgi:hypothetical protein
MVWIDKNTIIGCAWYGLTKIPLLVVHGMDCKK